MRQLLSISSVYSSFAKFVTGNGRFIDIYGGKHLRAKSGDKILDIGCGPGSILEVLPENCIYTGFDLSASYIAAAKKDYDTRGTFFVSGVDKSLIGALPGHDLAIATGVLHHLPDHLAQLLLEIAWSNLKPGGRLVTSDGCITGDQPRVNRWMVGKDRGEFVRPADCYKELASSYFQIVELFVYHDLLRIPYSHAIMECTRENI